MTTSNVSPVILTVLELANLKGNRLPSASAVNNMNVQRLIASQKLWETLIKEQNLCLLLDETSKFGKKMEGFHVTMDNKDYYILGTRHIVTKSGQDTFSVLNNILVDIETVSESCENNTRKSVLLNLK